MIVRKSLNIRAILNFAGHHIVWLTVWIAAITTLYYFTHWSWLSIPWLPLSVVGTAVAFYVGFKNNQAYDRLWEGRKIWGSIVNSSRSWATTVKAYIYNSNLSADELYQIKQSLIHRHIAWLYTLREQLLVPTQWEHVSLLWRIGSLNAKRRDLYGSGAFEKEAEESNYRKYLPISEFNHNTNFSNVATQIIDKQTQELEQLCRDGNIDLFKQLELQKILSDFYTHQGQAERLKKFPLPRQYGSFSFVFVCIFIFLLPFGIVGEFGKIDNFGYWLSIPFGVVIGWVYVVMELIGDYSENPFEGLFNDVPMLSICRTIEIDLLQMLGETHIPNQIQPKNGILM